jgi:NDP-sugar pyrophosphorylase family protein
MIGLIPAAGHATRLHGLPKYLLPVPDGYLLSALCRKMTQAGANHLLIGANEENYGLLRRYAPGGAMIYVVESATMNETLLAARERIDVNLEENVLFGMPDSYWGDERVYQRLQADLGLYPFPIAAVAVWLMQPEQHGQLGSCEVSDGEIVRIVDKSPDPRLRYAWGAVAFRPDFWQYIVPHEPHIGYALSRALVAGERVGSLIVEGHYHDCGTPDGYFTCIREVSERVRA